MSGKTEITDKLGRHVRNRPAFDDRGERFPIVMAQPANARGKGPNFDEVWRTESMENARRGHVTFSFSATFDDDTRLFSVLYLEVQVLGYVGNSPVLLLYTTIDPNGLGEYEWTEPDSFSNLAFAVRQNIDGVNTSDVTGITSCLFNVQGAYWR